MNVIVVRDSDDHFIVAVYDIPTFKKEYKKYVSVWGGWSKDFDVTMWEVNGDWHDIDPKDIEGLE